MFKKNLLLTAIFLMLSVSLFAGKKKVNFSGKWVLDKEKTEIAENSIFLTEISIKHVGDSLFTIRSYESDYDGGVYPFDEDLTLDGKEYEIYIYDMPRTASAKWSDKGKSIIINSKVTFYGDQGDVDMIAEETFTLEKKGTLLIINSKNKTGEEETEGILYFNKEESSE
ncbi:MAG: hypothetical protein J7K53_13720 [Bacteroidales bacterium]|nr:hypothetical protein [Bacteroidales bacterium]